MGGPEERENSLHSFRRLLNRIGEPPAYVTTQRNQLRYRFILGFTLIACPIFIFAQIVSDTDFFGIPIFAISALCVFASLILSRNGHLNMAIALDLLLFSIYPYVSLILKETWSLEYSILILIWVPITMLIGGYLLGQREAALFIATHDIIFLVVVLFHPGASIFMSAFLESIIPIFSISLLIFVGSWARQRHIDQLDQLNHELDSKIRELNIYTSLLIHDIGNDLQLSLINTELASQLLVSDSKSAREHLSTALTVEQRTSALLKVFSEPQAIIESDIVSLIEIIAEEAQRTYRNLEITVTTDEQCRSYGVVSRLLPMVFTNLFRNSAMHAGKTPKIKIVVTMNENEILIIVIDNGPGIDPSIRDSLFEKGVFGTSSEGTGMGLYLVRQIIQMHDGTISLIEESDNEGCEFRITLPLTSFTRLT